MEPSEWLVTHEGFQEMSKLVRWGTASWIPKKGDLSTSRLKKWQWTILRVVREEGSSLKYKFISPCSTTECYLWSAFKSTKGSKTAHLAKLNSNTSCHWINQVKQNATSNLTVFLMLFQMVCSTLPHRASFINGAKLICFYTSQLRTCQLLLGLTGEIFDSLKLLFRKWCGQAWVLSL